jgi:hypothetical protein
MNNCRTHQHDSPPPRKVPSLPAILALMCLLAVSHGFGQTATDTASDRSAEITLEQFRAQVATRLAQDPRRTNKSRDPLPSPDLRPADEVFLQLLMIQARDVAVNQSIDRLSEWTKAIQARFQIQNAPELDVAVARFAEARMAVESARIEVEQSQIIERANALLGRPATTALVALLPKSSATEKQAEEVLKQGEDLVAKMYENYQFGGISITSLMEYEHAVYEFELDYRGSLARHAISAASESPGEASLGGAAGR